MIGATLHTVIRSQGRYDGSGDWRPDYQAAQFDVLGTLEQTSPRQSRFEPSGAPPPAATWVLTLAPMERELYISDKDDARGGDRVRHGGRLLSVVAVQELPSVGGLSTLVYTLVDPGQDPTEVAP